MMVFNARYRNSILIVVFLALTLCIRCEKGRFNEDLLGEALKNEEADEIALARVKARAMEMDMRFAKKMEKLDEMKSNRANRAQEMKSEEKYTSVLHTGFQASEIFNRKEQDRNDKMKMLQEKNAQGDMRSQVQKEMDKRKEEEEKPKQGSKQEKMNIVIGETLEPRVSPEERAKRDQKMREESLRRWEAEKADPNSHTIGAIRSRTEINTDAKTMGMTYDGDGNSAPSEQVIEVSASGEPQPGIILKEEREFTDSLNLEQEPGDEKNAGEAREQKAQGLDSSMASTFAVEVGKETSSTATTTGTGGGTGAISTGLPFSLDGMLETLSTCQVAQNQQSDISRLLNSWNVNGTERTQGGGDVPASDPTIASKANESSDNLVLALEVYVGNLQKQNKQMKVSIASYQGMEKKLTEAENQLETMRAKAKIAKNEQVAASLTSENAQLECEVAVAGYKERISLLETEVFSLNRKLEKYSSIRKTAMPPTDPAIMGALPPGALSQLSDVADRDQISGNSQSEVCTCAQPEVGRDRDEINNLDFVSGVRKETTLGESDKETLNQNCAIPSSTQCAQILTSELYSSGKWAFERMRAVISGEGMRASSQSSKKSSEAIDDEDDLALWERKMDIARHMSSGILREGELSSEKQNAALQSNRSEPETLTLTLLRSLTVTVKEWTLWAYRVLLREVLLLLTPLYDWVLLPFARGFVYVAGSGKHRPFDAKEAALHYQRYAGSTESTTNIRHTEDGDNSNHVDPAVVEALYIVESYFGDSMYYLPDWADTLIHRLHGFAYSIFALFIDFDGWEDLVGRIVIMLRSISAGIQALIQSLINFCCYSPGLNLSAILGDTLAVTVVWCIVISYMIISILMLMKQMPKIASGIWTNLMNLRQKSRVLRMMMGFAALSLSILMLPLITVSWIFGVSKRSKNGRNHNSSHSNTDTTRNTSETTPNKGAISGGALSSKHVESQGETGITGAAGNTSTNYPRSPTGKSVSEAVLSALRESERVRRHKRHDDEVRQQQAARLATSPSGGEDIESTAAAAAATPAERMILADTHDTVDSYRSPVRSEQAMIAGTPATTAKEGTVSESSHRGESLGSREALPSSRSTLTTPRSYAKQMKAEEEAMRYEKEENMKRAMQEAERRENERKKSLLSKVVPAFLRGNARASDEQSSTSLIEERINEMTYPRGLSISAGNASLSSSSVTRQRAISSSSFGSEHIQIIASTKADSEGEGLVSANPASATESTSTWRPTNASSSQGGSLNSLPTSASGSLEEGSNSLGELNVAPGSGAASPFPHLDNEKWKQDHPIATERRTGHTVEHLTDVYHATRAAARLQTRAKMGAGVYQGVGVDMADIGAGHGGNKVTATRIVTEALQAQAQVESDKGSLRAGALEAEVHTDTVGREGDWSDMATPTSSAGVPTPSHAALLPPRPLVSSDVGEAINSSEDRPGREQRVITELMAKIRKASESEPGPEPDPYQQSMETALPASESMLPRSQEHGSTDREEGRNLPTNSRSPSRKRSPVPAELNIYNISDDTDEDGEDDEDGANRSSGDYNNNVVDGYADTGMSGMPGMPDGNAIGAYSGESLPAAADEHEQVYDDEGNAMYLASDGNYYYVHQYEQEYSENYEYTYQDYPPGSDNPNEINENSGSPREQFQQTSQEDVTGYYDGEGNWQNFSSPQFQPPYQEGYEAYSNNEEVPYNGLGDEQAEYVSTIDIGGSSQANFGQEFGEGVVTMLESVPEVLTNGDGDSILRNDGDGDGDEHLRGLDADIDLTDVKDAENDPLEHSDMLDQSFDLEDAAAALYPSVSPIKEGAYEEYGMDSQASSPGADPSSQRGNGVDDIA